MQVNNERYNMDTIGNLDRYICIYTTATVCYYA